MAAPRRALPATEDQKLFLVSYMETHVAFSQGEFQTAMGKEDLRRKWKSLAETLNGIPLGSEKTPKQWHTVCTSHLMVLWASTVLCVFHITQ